MYFAEHPAVALIEVLVNLEGAPDLLPDTFQLIKAEASERVSISALNRKTLPTDWRNNISMLTTLISADRGEAYPRGISYPMIDLALDGIIHTIGLEQLDPRFFPDRVLPRTKG